MPNQWVNMAFAALALAVGLGATVASGGDGQQSSPAAQDPIVTPVEGPSVLARLGLPYTDTSLGRGAGRYGPSPSDTGGKRSAIPLGIGQPVQISGADIYRLNCQACHRAEGTGAPPEIKSVVAAVQGSTLEAVRKQLQAEGRGVKPGAARAQADAARADLYRRIQKGGQRMPPLAHLQQADIDLLYGYLTGLAGGRETAPAARHTISWHRLGEQTVKGTCHVCHDAVGPRPSAPALLRGAVPPLTAVLQSNNVVDFMTKVRSGAPILMGDPPMHHRGRMPVFHYLRDEELAAAYMFLIAFPPRAGALGRRD
jgi:mono/diheme cytochrome c family protein